MSICFFIGHRDAPDSIGAVLEESINCHIRQYGVTEFVVGRYGHFDRMGGQAVIKAKRTYPEIRLMLLMAYYHPVLPLDLLSGFDGTLYPDGMERVPPRFAIIRANQYMIQHSQYLITYDAGQIGNTRALMKYAMGRERRGLLHIDNLAKG